MDGSTARLPQVVLSRSEKHSFVPTYAFHRALPSHSSSCMGNVLHTLPIPKSPTTDSEQGLPLDRLQVRLALREDVIARDVESAASVTRDVDGECLLKNRSAYLCSGVQLSSW
ncbi:hypothetical protein BD414DRAFT_66461 [Trametes punicea]|nr:hypothetical protein BD414DRAFT_66461 [Trametes punicea]